MRVIHSENEKSGDFTAILEGREAGKMTYSSGGENTFSIDHTEVISTYKGKGVGKELLKSAAEYARNNNFKIIPQCSFARILFEKYSEFDDVIN